MEIIFPKPSSCSGCGRSHKLIEKYKMCLECYERLEMTNQRLNAANMAFDNGITICSYQSFVRELIHKLKYKDKREIAITFGKLMALRIREEAIACDLIVPVPISNKKLQKRGYNHTTLMARELSEILNVGVKECLERIKDTKPQVLFNSNDRWYNVKGCFNCKENLEGKRVLLIDDIFTTGATAHYCAEALKANGAESVTLLAFANAT